MHTTFNIRHINTLSRINAWLLDANVGIDASNWIYPRRLRCHIKALWPIPPNLRPALILNPVITDVEETSGGQIINRPLYPQRLVSILVGLDQLNIVAQNRWRLYKIL